jgi:glyoxylase-like metal-dependent hydrolase (beta-lactamase superfamily II)
MQLHTIDSGKYKVDGGAFFGIIPWANWSKVYSADNLNRCTIAMRNLLVETGERLILIDTGMGKKQSGKFFEYHELHEEMGLVESLKEAGFSADDITDVFLTHLHFDHCGGAVEIDKEGNYATVFKNAAYWSNLKHWNWAMEANEREKYSFLKENILPIQQSGQLKFVPEDGKLFPGFDVQFLFGHTYAMMMPSFSYRGTKVVFVSDLIPSIAHIPLPYVMAYDINPLKTIEEKRDFLISAVAEKYVLFFQHDCNATCCTVKKGDKYPVVDKIFSLHEINEVVFQ